MTSTRKRKAQKIVHPIWSHCALLTDDPFWKDIYTTGSYGKMPKNFVYSNGVLGFSKIKKYKSITIPQNPSEAFNISITFFRENGLVSERDQMSMAEDEGTIIPDGVMSIDALPKSKRKKKTFIEFVISDFAHRYCTFNNIPQSRNILYATLLSAYRNKYLNDVHIRDGVVVGVTGLSHSDDGRIIYSPTSMPKVAKNKYFPIVEALDPEFEIRDKSKVDLISRWNKLMEVIHHDSNRTMTMGQNHTDNSTAVSATE